MPEDVPCAKAWQPRTKSTSNLHFVVASAADNFLALRSSLQCFFYCLQWVSMHACARVCKSVHTSVRVRVKGGSGSVSMYQGGGGREIWIFQCVSVLVYLQMHVCAEL